jgi:hypothetical protein
MSITIISEKTKEKNCGAQGRRGDPIESFREISFWYRDFPMRRALVIGLAGAEFPAPGRARLQDAVAFRTSLDFARSMWYLDVMMKSVRIDNRKLMTHFGWAVEGVVR